METSEQCDVVRTKSNAMKRRDMSAVVSSLSGQEAAAFMVSEFQADGGSTVVRTTCCENNPYS